MSKFCQRGAVKVGDVLARNLIIFAFIFSLHLFAGDKILDTKEVWRKSLAAKGGRHLLISVDSLNEVISERASLGLFNVPVGESETLYAFPNKVWEWGEEKGYNPHLVPMVHVLQLDLGVSWTASLGVGSWPVSKIPASRLAESKVRILEKQLGLFLENPSEPMVLLSAIERRSLTTCKILLKGSTALEITIDYEFDCKTYLPSMISFRYPIAPELRKTLPTVGRDGQPKVLPTEFTTTVEYKDYKPVQGIMLPHTVVRKIQRVFVYKVQYKINPDYSRSIFDIPPGHGFDRYDWKAKPSPSPGVSK